MTLDDSRNLAIILGTVIAAATLVKGLIEYMRQNAQKRAEQYLSMREKFKKSDRFQELFELLDENNRLVAL